MAVSCMKKPRPEVLGQIPDLGQRFNPRRFFRDVVIIPASLAKYTGLSNGAKLMWAALNTYSDLPAIYPATKTLASQLGIRRHTAQRYLDELEKKRFIFVDRDDLHYSDKGTGGTPTYWFLWHEALAPLPDDAVGVANVSGVSESLGVAELSRGPEAGLAPLTPHNSGTQTGLSNKQVQKEQNLPLSVLGASVCGENDDEADYCFASPKTGDGSPGVSMSPGENQNQKTRPHLDSRNAPEVGVAAPQNPSMIEKPKSTWTALDISDLQRWLSAFMEGEEPPAELVNWIVFDLSARYDLKASDIHRALDAAWKRNARPGGKNAPRDWNWFYETLRNALIPGYAARLPEAPAVPRPAHQANAEGMRGIEALELPDAPDSLVASYRCKCGGEIWQYQDRVVGTCVCAPAQTARAEATQMPVRSQRCLAEQLRRTV